MNAQQWNHGRPRNSRRDQRGVIVLIALIAMLALGYAGAALMRSVDATTGITGNIGLSQAAMLATDGAIENAIAALFERHLIADPANDDETQSYYASRQPQEDARGVPYRLQQVASYADGARVIDAGNGNVVRYLIERMCTGSGPAIRATCVLTPAIDAATPGTVTNPEPPPVALYRQTIRVDGPAGTIVFAQAWLADAPGRRRLSWRVLAD
jgi:type IV pilus assembly protein PilX